MNKKSIIILTLILLFFSYCEKNDETTYSIYNKWQWIMTSNGTRGPLKVPGEKYPQYFIQLKDNGEFLYYDSLFQLKNKSEIEISEIEYNTGNVVFTNDTLDIKFGYKILHDTLIFFHQGIDPAINYYTCVK